eukprot:351509-Chlamydomonas_euryale.AAC.2
MAEKGGGRGEGVRRCLAERRGGWLRGRGRVEWLRGRGRAEKPQCGRRWSVRQTLRRLFCRRGVGGGERTRCFCQRLEQGVDAEAKTGADDGRSWGGAGFKLQGQRNEAKRGDAGMEGERGGTREWRTPAALKEAARGNRGGKRENREKEAARGNRGGKRGNAGIEGERGGTWGRAPQTIRTQPVTLGAVHTSARVHLARLQAGEAALPRRRALNLGACGRRGSGDTSLGLSVL